MGSPLFGKQKEFPQYAGKKLCQDCAIDVFEEACSQTPTMQIKGEDFADLRKSLTESGIVVSAFNCPKCNGMNDIPETGKILICKHCGKPIKPKDIEEKIKELTK